MSNFDYLKFTGLNFKNYLKNLGSCWDGFTTLDLLKEFYDNGLDWGATWTKIKASNKHIIYTDNGTGMNKENLFRLAEFYSSNNDKLRNGKFGIGGNKAQVALSDLDDTWYNKKIKIITKLCNGEVRSIEINWGECETLSNYADQINSSFKLNNNDDKMIVDNVVSGTFIKISTSESRVDEISKFSNNLNALIDLSVTYSEYIEKGKEIFIGDKKIIAYIPNEDIINQAIKIKYFRCGSTVSYSAKINNLNGEKFKETCWALKPNGNGMSTTLKQEPIPASYEERAEIILRLKFDMNMYNRCSRGKGSVLSSDFPEEFGYFISELSGNIYHDNDISEKYLEYINELYVKRESSLNIKRTLGTLNINPKDGGDYWKRTIFKYIDKSIEFSQLADEELKLVQSNKSKVEWDKTPNKLERMIQLCIIKFRDDVLSPKFTKEDNIIRKKDTTNIILENHLIEKLNQKNAISKLEQYYLNYRERNEKYPLALRYVVQYFIKERIENPAAIKIQTCWRNYKLYQELDLQKKRDAINIIENSFINYKLRRKELKNKKFKEKLPNIKIKFKFYLANIKDISSFKVNFNKIINIAKELELDV